MEAITPASPLPSNSNVFAALNTDDNDNVYIAHCYPYTYTRLLKFIKGLESDPVKRTRFQKKFLCLS